MILSPVASFSQSMSPWRAMATPFRPEIPKFQPPLFSIYSQMSNGNSFFDFLVGTFGGVDPSEKKHIECLYL